MEANKAFDHYRHSIASLGVEKALSLRQRYCRKEISYAELVH